jgi:hypothetical protein
MFWRAIREEFHTQRFVIYSGGALAVLLYALLHVGPWRKPDLNFDFFHFVGSLTCMAFAAIAGSFAFGRHSGESRIPINKFLLKLAICAISTTASGLLMVLALALSVSIDSPDAFLESIYPDFTYLQHSIVYLSGPFIVFACSVLFSLIQFRRGVSALLGFAAGAAVFFCITSFWVRLDFNMWIAKKPVNPAILLSGALLLFLAWGCSSRLRVLSPSARFILGISAALISALSSSTLLYLMRPSPAALHMGGPSLSPMGTEIVSDAYAEDTYKQIWIIPTDTGKGTRIIKKQAYDPVVSPDGRWFAFFSQEGIFGLRSFYVDLRVARIDGTQENVVLPKFARWISDEHSIGVDGTAFSPDSKYLVLLCYTMIYVVDLEGNLKSQVALPPNSDKQLLGWRPGCLEVLLADINRRCIEIYDVTKREFRPLYQAKQAPERLAPVHSGAGIRYVGFGNELVDLNSGSARPFPEYIGRELLDISIDQSTLLSYINSEEFKPETSIAAVHRFDIKSGRDELCAEFKGVIKRLVNSPDGSRTALEHRTEYDQIQTIVIKGNSVVRRFEGWALIGWRDSGRVVLADRNLFPKRIALGDIDTGQIHQFYP